MNVFNATEMAFKIVYNGNFYVMHIYNFCKREEMGLHDRTFYLLYTPDDYKGEALPKPSQVAVLIFCGEGMCTLL